MPKPTTFDEWMNEFDRVLEINLKLKSSDLPDWSGHYRKWYDEGVRPTGAVARIIDAMKN